MSEDLTIVQFVLRLALLGILTGVAAVAWARPWRTGMFSTEVMALANRARTWFFVGLAGMFTYGLRLSEAYDELVRFAGTVFVVLIVGVGIDSLKHRGGRRR